MALRYPARASSKLPVRYSLSEPPIRSATVVAVDGVVEVPCPAAFVVGSRIAPTSKSSAKEFFFVPRSGIEGLKGSSAGAHIFRDSDNDKGMRAKPWMLHCTMA